MDKNGMFEVGSVEGLNVLIDGPSRDFVLAFRTDFGTVVKALRPEEALRLGVLLIRETGRRRVFHPTQPAIQPEEDQHASDDSGDSSGGVGEPSVGPRRHDAGELAGDGLQGGNSGGDVPDSGPISLEPGSEWSPRPWADHPGGY